MVATLHRRDLMGAGMALFGMRASAALAKGFQQPLLARVILDNDYAGDPDGLFQLAHHVLCRSVKIQLIIGSHLPASFASGHDASDAARRARDLLHVMGLDHAYDPIAGAEAPITPRGTPRPSAATPLIVREAMSDAPEPLIYAAGAGLTELALAWLSEPRIGRRIKLIWIGGNTHPGFANPGPTDKLPEFNFSIDPFAAQVIFNQSDIEIWQVPADQYRTMLFGSGELDELGTIGPLGAFLKAAVDAVPEMFSKIPGLPPVPQTDAYVLGDSPLVTLSALVTPFAPDPASSHYRLIPTPKLNDDGSYSARPDGRPMRVYTSIDASLTFRDMLAKFRMLALAQRTS
jgi:purine nucleosidase